MTDTPTTSGPSRWLHFWAIVTACATLPLMIMGAEVTSKGVGMVDEQPVREPWHVFVKAQEGTTLGYLIEHSHRFLGFVAGTCTIILLIMIFRQEKRSWVKWLGVLVLLGICIQGFLGAMRVHLNAWLGHELKLIHGLFAQIVFSLMVTVALVTSPRWQSLPISEPSEGQTAVRRWSLIVILVIFGQIILGGLTRHYGYPWAPRLHVLGAVSVVAAVVWLIHLLVTHGLTHRPFSGAMKLLGLFLIVQIVLGMEAWLTKFQTVSATGVPLQPLITPGTVGAEGTFGNLMKALLTHPDLFRSLHFITGSMILATCVSLSLVLHRGLLLARHSHEPIRNLEGAT